MFRFRAAFAFATLVAVAPASVQALDFDGAMREVAAANPMLAAGRSDAAAARQQVGPAGAWQNPEFEIGRVRELMPTPHGPEMETMTMLGVSQRVSIFGANGQSRAAARSLASGSDARVRALRREMLADAWMTYATAWHAGERAAATRAHAAVMERAVWAARSRYGSGRGRLDEILRADAERARLVAAAEAHSAEALGARARLDALRGREVALVVTDSLAAPPAPALPVDPTPLRAAVDSGHPRLSELDARAAAYRSSASASRRALFPELELNASVMFLEDDPAHASYGNEWSASVAFMVPLFASSRELAEGATMESMAVAAESERRAAGLDLRARLEGALATADAARRRVETFEGTVVPAARAALESAWSAYGSGTMDLAAVLDVSHALYDQELELSRAREAFAMACARLYELTGRGDLLGVAMPVEEQP
jgi:cobalt-zinc-cadmium efflux system outer membrane protein